MTGYTMELYEIDGPGSDAYKKRMRKYAKDRADRGNPCNRIRGFPPCHPSRQPITANGEDWREPVNDIVGQTESYRQFIVELRQPAKATK